MDTCHLVSAAGLASLVAAITFAPHQGLAQPSPHRDNNNNDAGDREMEREEPLDYDHEQEQYSDFWERALSPAADTYTNLIDYARRLIDSKTPISPANAIEARALLGDAIRIQPDRALAHFWRGLLAQNQGNYKQCERSLAAAIAVEPNFIAPSSSRRLAREWQLHYEFGVCAARSGNLQEAVNQLRMITTRFVSCQENRRAVGCTTWQVPWRLGEALMALGRLEEAIESLEVAARRSIIPRYSLAVALDRDRQLAAMRNVLDDIRARDRQFHSLAPSRIYIPAEDEYYYRGLARAHRGDHGHARIFFAAYLKRATDSPWRQQASAHLRTSIHALELGQDIGITGPSALDRAQVEKALVATRTSLRGCLRSFPDQIFEIHLRDTFRQPNPHSSSRAHHRARKNKRLTPIRTVRINHMDPLDRRHLSTEIIAITNCLRARTTNLRFQHKAPVAGAWSEVSFQITAPQAP